MMMTITDRAAFFKYAVPCAEVYVRRGKISQKALDKMIEKVSQGKELPEKTEYLFETAPALCESLAKLMKKTSIDNEVIRQYFLVEHNSIVEKRADMYRDVDVEKCKTKLGIISKVDGKKALVDIGNKEMECRRDFFSKAKEGDNAILHYGFIVDILTNREVSKYFGSSAKKYLPM